MKNNLEKYNLFVRPKSRLENTNINLDEMTPMEIPGTKTTCMDKSTCNPELRKYKFFNN